VDQVQQDKLEHRDRQATRERREIWEPLGLLD